MRGKDVIDPGTIPASFLLFVLPPMNFQYYPSERL